MADGKVFYCQGCGAALEVDINREFIFCRYCGCRNQIESQAMATTINVNGQIQVNARTDIESIINSAEYAVSIGKIDEANDMLISAIMSGVNDYRVYCIKARIDLIQDNNKSLFESLTRLRNLEQKQSPEGEVTRAVCEFMRFRGKNGVIALHIATFQESMDWTIYCVEHGADINCVAGMNMVTPISIMFVPVSPKLSKMDGTPFVRNKMMVKEIRKYLMSRGARDKFRLGY